MRTESAEGRDFLSALDALRAAERPRLDRTAMIKKLVFDAEKKLIGKNQRAPPSIRNTNRNETLDPDT